MADVYATIAEADVAVQEQLSEVLELRAADPAQRAMSEDYLARIDLAPDSRVLDIGCGTGAITRLVAALEPVGEAVGVDPSPVFVARARELGAGEEFIVADARELPFGEGEFHAVVCHTSLCHIPGPERVLAEAARVCVPGGSLALFDGDYVTTTVAIAEHDPLQACVDAVVEALVFDRLLVRRLRPLVLSTGWEPLEMRSHGYVETTDPGYTLTLVDRGADVLERDGVIGAPKAQALKDEARRRVAEDRWFGQISYASLIARRAGV